MLSVVLLVGAIAPAGAWRCENGQLCPTVGAMPLHPQVAARPAMRAGHSCCHLGRSSQTVSRSGLASGMRCIFTHADPAAASLTKILLPNVDSDAQAVLLPAVSYLIRAVRSTAWIVLSSDLPPPLFLSSLSGRSPPPHAS